MIKEIFVYVFKKHELAGFGMIEHKFWYFFSHTAENRSSMNAQNFCVCGSSETKILLEFGAA